MKTIKKMLITGALIATLGGCGFLKDNHTIEGIVKEEFELSAKLVPSNGGLLSGESTKIQKDYGFVLETKEGNYTVAVKEDYNKPLVALANRIKVGSKVKIVDDRNGTYDDVYFDKDNIGYALSNEVEVLE